MKLIHPIVLFIACSGLLFAQDPGPTPIDPHGGAAARESTGLPPGHPPVDPADDGARPLSAPAAPRDRGGIPSFESRVGAVDVSILRDLAILSSGRVKPLDTFAIEGVAYLTGKREFRDPSFGDAAQAPAEDAILTLLRLVFEPEAFVDHHNVEIDYLPLKAELGIDPARRWFACSEITTPRFFELANTASEKDRDEEARRSMPRLEREALAVWNKIAFVAGVGSRTSLRVVPPPPGSGSGDWLTIDRMEGYPPEQQERIFGDLAGLARAFTQNDAAGFEKAAATLKADLRSLHPEAYPPAEALGLEVAYNSLRPFLLSWAVYLAGALLLALSWPSRSRLLYGLSVATLLAGFGLHSYGLWMRIAIAGRAPVSNMYESMIFAAWALVLFALIFEAIYRTRTLAMVGSVMSVITLILADSAPLSASIDPLVPVLKSYWLIYHVLCMMLSYAAIGLAAGLAHVYVGFAGFAPGKKSALPGLARYLYRVEQVGCFLLATGLILGAVWASESWGRYWGWDAKEVWALITLLWYIAVLHGRFTGWLREFGVAMCSSLGFPVLLMTYYGVNFVLPALGIKSLRWRTRAAQPRAPRRTASRSPWGLEWSRRSVRCATIHRRT
ncbi:MAG: cytochrome c biogenesis protein CcsA [Planctomycetes bacterium]|nr:cytochrome c biogenesis protein CcsA [Planctomycetota bacterium]